MQESSVMNNHLGILGWSCPPTRPKQLKKKKNLVGMFYTEFSSMGKGQVRGMEYCLPLTLLA